MYTSVNRKYGVSKKKKYEEYEIINVKSENPWEHAPTLVPGLMISPSPPGENR